ncbi:MAG: cyclic-di-AMP receptor [Chloroflexota bacterium]|nr:cyclic-di-AMP receptor [Chloroflexota bacterium]
MKMILAIVSSEDADGLTEALLKADFGLTTLATVGGFLRRQYATLLIGTKEERVDEALELIKANTKPHKGRLPLSAGPGNQEIGAATVFVLNMGEMYRY